MIIDGENFNAEIIKGKVIVKKGLIDKEDVKFISSK